MIGFILNGSTPSNVNISSIEPIPIGKYVKISTKDGDIIGLVSKSIITSSLLESTTNVEDIQECCDIVQNKSKRDKSYISNIDILGFIDGLDKGNRMLPSTAIIPGTQVTEPTDDELDKIFNPNNEKWGKIGILLRNEKVQVKFNIDKIVSRHLGILAMTGMGKSNLVSLITKQISEKNGTVIIFDYHRDYFELQLPNVNQFDAKINPRLLDSDEFSDIIEIRVSSTRQRNEISKVLSDAQKDMDFWDGLETRLTNLVNDNPKKQNIYAMRVLEIIKNARYKFQNILDPEMSNEPITYIKEGKINVVNISELSESQANVAMSFYLYKILNDRKTATINSDKKFHFKSPVFSVIEEAHVFIPKGEHTKAKDQISKIAREGRKFGVGMCIVSQRPRSIDENVLSQMGSFAIMKIIQDSDQNQIANATESANRELIDQLTSLNVGDAILLGQWCNLTSLVHVDEVKEKVAGADQSAIDAWSKNTSMEINDSHQGTIRRDMLHEQSNVIN